MKVVRLAFFLVLVLGRAHAAFAQADERVIYAGVVDKNGDAVLDLSDKDFVVREDGQAREILRVTPDHDPLQIALLVDNSESMRNNIGELRRAATAFVDNTREEVQIALITLVDRPTIAVDYTADHAALKKGIDNLFAYPEGLYLLDGIAEISQGLVKRPTSRSVIAVITGVGMDYSYRNYTEVLESLRESGASLHVLTLGMGSAGHDDEVVIGQGTSETGGRNENVMSATGLGPRARQFAVELSNQYRIAYARPQRLIPPKNTVVTAKRPELRARGMVLKTEKERQ